MGVVDNFIKFMQLKDNDEDQDIEETGGYKDDEDEDAYVEPEREEKKFSLQQNKETDSSSDMKIRSFSMQKGKKMPPIQQENSEVVIFKPTDISEAREITNTLRANKSVVVNLENTDDATAQRIIDFTSGACFAIDGTLQKISNYIFLVTPSTVDITGSISASGSSDLV